MDEREVQAFLIRLADDRQVAGSTHRRVLDPDEHIDVRHALHEQRDVLSWVGETRGRAGAQSGGTSQRIALCSPTCRQDQCDDARRSLADSVGRYDTLAEHPSPRYKNEVARQIRSRHLLCDSQAASWPLRLMRIKDR